MGTWGHNSFENDDAMDWVIDLEDADSSAIDDALDAVTADADEDIEAPEAAAALAAAETVAAMAGNRVAELPDEVNRWLRKTKRIASAAIVAKAITAIEAVHSHSELQELWKESDNYEKWQASIEDLLSRLRQK